MILGNILALAALTSSALAAPTSQTAASSRVIPGSYIITLKDNVEAPAMQAHINWVGAVHKRSINKRDTTGVAIEYAGTFKGYAGSFDEDTIAQIRDHPDVVNVEQDKMWHLAYQKSSQQPIRRAGLVNQKRAPYGLGSVSHRTADIWEYIYDATAGHDTYAYVLDTGIRITHYEFQGRAKNVYTAFPGQWNDTHGHGTHVSGTIIGNEFGVAKNATALSVKVFEGEDSPTSTILGGYNWAVNDIIANNRQNSSVINMSLEGEESQAYNDALKKAYKAGILSVVAAGNKAKDASNVSPASSPYAFTVGAVDRDWIFAEEYSNYGKALDILGPGTDVLSAWNDGDGMSRVISGTSMATPHIAGLALYAMSIYNVHGPKAITDFILSTATKGAATGSLQGSPNLIGNNNNKLQPIRRP